MSGSRIVRLAAVSASVVTACAVAAAVLTHAPAERLSVVAPLAASSSVTLSLPAPTPAPKRADPPQPAVQARAYVPQITQAPVPAPARRGAHTALIIGIDDTDPKNPLFGARADATTMRDALLEYGFRSSDVVVLLDGAATRSRILAELRSLVARTPSDGLAVFAAASHGAGTSFRTADGARLSASELGHYLGEIRAPVWSALAMCYAAGFSVPGVVGADRVATFSSTADQLTYEIPGAGSELFYAMVKEGMIGAGAPRSVESAFAFARAVMARDGTNAPVISDGVGELVLGPVTWGPPVTSPPPPSPVPVAPDPTPSPDPSQPPGNGGRGGILCGLLGCHTRG
jgi:hypothetical protein